MVDHRPNLVGQQIKSERFGDHVHALFEEALDVGMAAPGPYLIDVDMEHFAPMEISIMPKKRTPAA